MCRWMSVMPSPASVEDPRITEDAGRYQPDVQVRQHQRAELDPCELHVPRVQLRDLRPDPVSDPMLGEVLQPATGDVPARVAGQRISPDEDDVHQQDQRTDADPE